MQIRRTERKSNQAAHCPTVRCSASLAASPLPHLFPCVYSSSDLDIEQREVLGVVVGHGLAVDGVTERVDDASEQLRSRRDRHDLVRAERAVTLRHLVIVTEESDSDQLLLEVEGDSADAALEADLLTGLDVGQTNDLGDSVTDRRHQTDLLEVNIGSDVDGREIESGSCIADEAGERAGRAGGRSDASEERTHTPHSHTSRTQQQHTTTDECTAHNSIR